MKPHKTAQQRNVLIDCYVHTDERLRELLDVPGVFSSYQVDCSATTERDILDSLAISLKHVKDLRVELDEYGYYCNVAVMNSGEHIYIVL